jgi:hypothetical protein
MQLLLPLIAVSLHSHIKRKETDLLCAVGFVILFILHNEIEFYFHILGTWCSYSNIYLLSVFLHSLKLLGMFRYLYENENNSPYFSGYHS